jgi:energy-coupling factor transport system substrate-specific component
MLARLRPALLYGLVTLVGAGAFLYPFWLPAHALPDSAHRADAPLLAAAMGALVVVALTLELRRGTINGATVAILGLLAAVAGLFRLLDLPGGGSGIFFLVVLGGAAFGPRFGLLLGLSAMATSAVLTGGIGPWLPFQMLALAWMGAGAGVVGLATRRLPLGGQVAALAVYGWVWGFVFGAVMNLYFWPFVDDGGPLSFHAGDAVTTTLHRYYSFYLASSFAWDAAGALANAVLIALTGAALLSTLRRFASRLRPAVELEPLPTQTNDKELLPA